jgi:hypothetical protein
MTIRLSDRHTIQLMLAQTAHLNIIKDYHANH